MHTTVYSGAIVGIEGLVVEVEVDIARGIPAFSVVGLPNASVRESRERVTSAIKNTGCKFPLERITCNLAPADVKKEGSGYDLAIAIGILLASGQADATTTRTLFIGELALDGGVRRVPGVLPILLHARSRGFARAVIPYANLEEARMVEGIDVIACETLRAAIVYALATREGEDAFEGTLDGRVVVKRADEPAPPPAPETHSSLDMADVVGQEAVKRALLIAAAGGHHLLMVGPPGAGKTMLARRFITILPPLSPSRAMETTMIYSIMGLLHHVSRGGLVTHAPLRAPHHTASYAGLIGGTANPRPGEITLAHNGVLFLDELPEFPRHVLETLREPLEEGHITISRARSAVTYPARFQLIAAMNPWRSVAILSLAYYVLETWLPGRSENRRGAPEETPPRPGAQPEAGGPQAGRQPMESSQLGERKDQTSGPLLPGDYPLPGLQPAPETGRFLSRAAQGRPEGERPVVEAARGRNRGLGDNSAGLGERNDASTGERALRPCVPLFGALVIHCEKESRYIAHSGELDSQHSEAPETRPRRRLPLERKPGVHQTPGVSYNRRNQASNRRWSPDTVISAVSLAIAVSALGLTVWEAQTARRHDYLSVLPSLQVTRDYSRPDAGILVENKGLGFGRVRYAALHYEGKEYAFDDSHDGFEPFRALIPSLHYLKVDRRASSLGDMTPLTSGLLIKPGETVRVISMPRNAVSDSCLAVFVSEMARVGLTITYEDAYENPFGVRLEAVTDR